MPGQTVVATAARVALYADVTRGALVLDTYGPGTLLAVLEPTGDHPGYPVLNEGQTWVRVRAVDGLVGWVMGSQVEVE